MPGSIIPLINKYKEDNNNKRSIITKIEIKVALYCLKYYINLNFINNNICTLILKAINSINGTNEEVKIAIIDFNDSGPVIIFLFKKK